MLGGSDVDSVDSRAGLGFEASAILPLRTSLDLQLGAAYAAKGATEEESGLDLEFGYLEIPFRPRLAPSVVGTRSPYFIGSALALRLICYGAVAAEGSEVSIDCEDELDDLKSLDFEGRSPQ